MKFFTRKLFRSADLNAIITIEKIVFVHVSEDRKPHGVTLEEIE